MKASAQVKKLPGILLLALCIALLAWTAVDRFSRAVGVDFYHYWAVQTALSEGDLRGRNPYAFTELYYGAMNGIAQRTEDQRLRAAAAFRPDLDLTGTPLQYMLFSVLPGRYSTALAVYQVVQLLCFAGAVVLLFRARWPRWLWAAALIALTALFYAPLEWDILVGNLNSIQALAITALACMLERGPKGGKSLFVALFLSALTALVLLKPSILLVCLALACSLWWRERPSLWRSAWPAALCGALLIALPCLYFGSWTVWADWARFLRDPERAALFFPTEWGNFSTVVLLMEDMRIDYAAALLIVGALFVGGALLGMALGGGGNHFRAMLEDPFRLCSLAIVITAAISPVYWPHYYLLCLFAALYLILPPRRPWLAVALAAASILLNFNWIPWALDASGLPWNVHYASAASWLLLVPVLFMTTPPAARRQE